MTAYRPAMLRTGFYALTILALAIPAIPCVAQTAEADSGQVIRLTPEQRARLLDSGTEAKADDALAQALGGGGSRGIHGEVGAMIGTGGARGVFGTAAIPLGDSGMAAFSFEDSRYGRRR